MKFFLNNMSEGWNDRLMEVIAHALPGDTIIVPDDETARDARIFAWAVGTAGNVHVLSRKEYEKANPGKGMIVRDTYKGEQDGIERRE